MKNVDCSLDWRKNKATHSFSFWKTTVVIYKLIFFNEIWKYKYEYENSFKVNLYILGV